MAVVYVVDGGMAVPNDSKEPLHNYHERMDSLVEADLLGLTGSGSQIRRVVLSEETDVSDLETYLNASLSVEAETE
jgi:hypothetical protein